MPFHRWIGTAALLLIMMHAWLTINRYGFYWQNGKMISGLLTGIALIGMVVTGWMRLMKPSGKLRIIHLRLGMILFFLIVIHIIF
ncbi:putative ferric reductase [Virgibacillus natechei]|uniref:Ferric reductase n=2 Tax=Virgibacillus natechei TaxID=1216297 RepID=A0ABS4IG36_9BACI|nr:putative ferric reductase [Virgibacillus natechei]